MCKQISKLAEGRLGQPKSSFFNSYYTVVVGKGNPPFTGFIHFNLDTKLIMLGVMQGDIDNFFESLVEPKRGLYLGLLDHWQHSNHCAK